MPATKADETDRRAADDASETLLELDAEVAEAIEKLMAEAPDRVASNDEWAFRKADQLVKKLPQAVGHDRRTEGEVFDHRTLMTLHRLLAQGVLRSLDFPVSTGKEANVFRGTTPTGGHVAVKIYRTNTATFKHVLQYIQGDERFQGVSGDKKALVHAWAQKEFRNLHRIRDAGVDVPEPIRVLQNVLVTEYIGIDEGPWPKLQDLGRLPDARPFYDKLVDDYVKMLNGAGLIHADFSPFNVLVPNADRLLETSAPRAYPRVIDVGQAVLRSHPHGEMFLDRDIENLLSWARRQGLRDAGPQDVRSRMEEP